MPFLTSSSLLKLSRNQVSCTIPINPKGGLRQAGVFPWVLGVLAPEPEVLVFHCLEQLPLVCAMLHALAWRWVNVLGTPAAAGSWMVGPGGAG